MVPETENAGRQFEGDNKFPLGETVKKRILIVEDEEMTRELLGDFLTMEGFEVRTASDGEEGLLFYHQFAPDLIVTDIKMPKKAGLELIAQLRATHSMIRTIYMSGCLDAPDVFKQVQRQLFEHPECQVLAKPFHLEQVTQSIERSLRHSEPRTARSEP